MTIFLATGANGIMRAAQGANGAWAVESALPNIMARCLSADPMNPEVIYAGTQARGVWRSSDQGRTWSPAGLGDKSVKAIAASPSQAGTVFAGTRPLGLFVTRDSGANWTEIESLRRRKQWWWFSPAEWPPIPYVQAIALSPSTPDVILVGIELGAVLRSADGGQTWSRHCRGARRDTHMLAFHASDGDWAYQAAGDGAAAVSDDGGRAWRGIGARFGRGAMSPAYGVTVGADRANPAIWYFATAPGPQAAHGGSGNARGHIFRVSADGVPTRLSGGLPVPLDYMPYALISPAGGELYAALSNGDIWHSSDYGANWAALPLNVGAVYPTVIALEETS